MLGVDPLYLLFALPAFLLVMYAQGRVQQAYNKYSEIPNSVGMTGAEVAQVLLQREQLASVQLEVTPQQLGDHYDPGKDILRLSPNVAREPSIAALAVTAHEVGHALQDRDNYGWMLVRTGLVPLLKVASTLGYLLFFAGILLGMPSLTILGIIGFSGGALFSLVTLPVEFNASQRAMKMLEDNNLIRSDTDREQARSMLNAAALTYVAGAAQALATVLYLVFRVMGMGSRRRGY